MKSSIKNVKTKEYIIQCFYNDAWWPIGDFLNKNIAVDTMTFKKKQQKSMKWRTLERVTVVKEKKVA